MADTGEIHRTARPVDDQGSHYGFGHIGGGEAGGGGDGIAGQQVHGRFRQAGRQDHDPAPSSLNSEEQGHGDSGRNEEHTFQIRPLDQRECQPGASVYTSAVSRRSRTEPNGTLLGHSQVAPAASPPPGERTQDESKRPK